MVYSEAHIPHVKHLMQREPTAFVKVHYMLCFMHYRVDLLGWDDWSILWKHYTPVNQEG